MLKKTIISGLLIGVVALAVASSGGGDKKKSDAKRKTDFTPIKTTNGFALQAGPVYSGSSILNTTRTGNFLSQRSVVTYQQGGTVIILPHQTRVRTTPVSTTITPFKSNLNFLDLKIRLRLHK